MMWFAKMAQIMCNAFFMKRMDFYSHRSMYLHEHIFTNRSSKRMVLVPIVLGKWSCSIFLPIFSFLLHWLSFWGISKFLSVLCKGSRAQILHWKGWLSLSSSRTSISEALRKIKFWNTDEHFLERNSNIRIIDSQIARELWYPKIFMLFLERKLKIP